MNRRNFLQFAAASALVAAHGSVLAAITGADRTRFTVFPGYTMADTPTGILSRSYGPLVSHVSGKLGRPSSVHIARVDWMIDRPSIRDADFLLAPGTTAAKLMLTGKFEPVLRSTHMAGGAFVASNPKIKTFASGLRVATAKDGAWLYRVSSLFMAQRGINPAEFSMVNEVDLVRHLLEGRTDVVSLREEVATAMADKGATLLGRLPITPDMTVLVASGLGRGERTALVEALLSLPDPAMQSLQRGIESPVPAFVATSAKEYQTLLDAMRA